MPRPTPAARPRRSISTPWSPRSARRRRRRWSRRSSRARRRAVFELPDMPAVDADPFAALEAELRAQDDEPEPSVAEQVAALAEESRSLAHETTEPAPLDLVMETVVEAEADPVFVLEAEVETLFAVIRDGGDDEATLEWPPPLPAEADPRVESSVGACTSRRRPRCRGRRRARRRSSPSARLSCRIGSSLPASTVVEALASEVPEAAGIRDRSRGIPTRPRCRRRWRPRWQRTRPPKTPCAPAPVSQTSEPEPAAPPKDSRDEVLGDLEDWLNTLQDRSEPVDGVVSSACPRRFPSSRPVCAGRSLPSRPPASTRSWSRRVSNIAYLTGLRMSAGVVARDSRRCHAGRRRPLRRRGGGGPGADSAAPRWRRWPQASATKRCWPRLVRGRGWRRVGLEAGHLTVGRLAAIRRGLGDAGSAAVGRDRRA